MKIFLFALSVVTLFGQAAQQKQERAPMTFFVTSVGGGNGANLGGLAGADAHCQKLAAAAGSPIRSWKAYLSASASDGKPAVNARDRIGKGPWHNQRGTMVARDLGHLHGDTLDEARVGNLITKNNALTEKGELVNGVGDKPNTHDILTGTQPDGRAYTDAADHTCGNWTSSGQGVAQLGHHDRNGGGISWNSTHPSRGCSQENLVATGGAGLFYCFAAPGN
ncbi:MAG TPA: hypothetical protein VL285_13755 [Bryobacteraceae bacterium]|jgi:hypothetical protein|nr:hypothetical protein [Bryobacteraceae bacterium]